MVKTRWRWVHCINLKDIAVDLSLEYLAPQEGQNLEWQRKGTNLRLPQWGQPYMAPAIRRIPAVNDLINVFHDDRSGFYIVFNDFVIVSEHLLNHIHEIIME